ncbi:metal ABC transporter substrate-binding protein [Barrientosiimonas marina]|uniref:Metal ABC transporter solute-binding protein, Zn/Mn family n=1 Tax=Lentibacillus kimchii TaxID=1542911 RepID=A0ABW2UU21_9BACI
MKKFILAAVVLLSMLLLAACGGEKASESGAEKGDDDKLQVIASFTILKDMVEQIGGDHVDVHNLVPTGTDPHEYEPLPEDIKNATDADLLLYNGMNLEGGEDGWFFKMIDAVGQDESNVFAASEGVEPMYIGGGEHDKEQNPHDFIDPDNGIKMAENVRDALIAVDPDREDVYQKQGDDYIDRLQKIEQDYGEKLGDIPAEDRILVTSERAYQYLADHYNMKEGFVYEIDTEENGTPEQIKDLVSFIEKNDPPALFVESNVDERPMETVSDESGAPIYDKPIYSDEIGEQGEEVDTYVKYLNYNLDILHDGLSR